MHRARMGALLLGGAFAVSQLVVAAPADASGIAVKVSPAKSLKNGQTVKVTGTGLPVTTNGKANAFFVDECNAAVTGRLSPADTPHCNGALAKALKVSKKGAFSTSFEVATGTVGDGVCGSPGHLTCVIGVGDAGGQGTVVKISFK